MLRGFLRVLCELCVQTSYFFTGSEAGHDDLTEYRAPENMLECYGAPHSFHVFLRWRPSTATSMRRVHLKMLLSLYGSVSTCDRDPVSSDSACGPSEVAGSPTRQPR